MSGWPEIEADLHRTLRASGRSEAAADAIIAELRPVFAAVERARGRVEDELAFALLAVAADRARRHARHETIDKQLRRGASAMSPAKAGSNAAP